MRFTIRPRFTAGRLAIASVQRWTFLYSAEGINLRGVFSFPIEQYAEQLPPSLAATKSRAVGA
jgi:hypothetical protein